jgi:hypothetical protein
VITTRSWSIAAWVSAESTLSGTATVAVPPGTEEGTCPVRALRRWLEVAPIDEGRVFRRIDRHGNLGIALSDRALGEIVAARASAAGLEGDFAGHSLRAGFATAAARAGPPKPRSCVMGAGRVCRSPAATSARARGGTTTPPPTLACKCGRVVRR